MTVEMERATEAQALPETLRHVPAMLCQEFGDVDADVVERTVAEAYRQLSEDARIVSFLPILTEKVARDRLVGRSHRRRHAVAAALAR